MPKPTLSMCMISNRPDRMKTFISSFDHIMDKSFRPMMSIVTQAPYTGRDRIDISKMAKEEYNVPINWLHVPPLAKLGYPYNAIDARRKSYQLGIDSDYIISVDDDMVFKGPSKAYKADSGDRLADSIEHLKDNPSCGIIQHMSFLGGSSAGLNIVPAKSGWWETSLGLMFRGGSKTYDERFRFLGAGNDVALCVSFVIRGQHIARNYNNPSTKDYSKTVDYHADNPSYKLHYIETEGMIACLRNKLGAHYQYGKPFDKTIQNLHRTAALKEGWRPVY